LTGPSPPNAEALFWGTGIFVTDSVILTAKHVANNCTEVRVTSATDAVHGAHANILAESWIDLALIEIAKPSAPVRPARFRLLWPSDAQMATLTDQKPSFLIEAAGPILALGYTTQRRMLTPDIQPISGLAASRPDLAEGFHPYVVFGPVEHGNSGGPLVDQDGSVVGMMTNKIDVPKLHAAIQATQSVPEFGNGLGVGFASIDLLAFIANSGISADTRHPITGEDAAKRATESIARVFCFR
jgi:S1-C subfamily serine protease